MPQCGDFDCFSQFDNRGIASCVHSCNIHVQDCEGALTSRRRAESNGGP